MSIITALSILSLSSVAIYFSTKTFISIIGFMAENKIKRPYLKRGTKAPDCGGCNNGSVSDHCVAQGMRETEKCYGSQECWRLFNE